MPPIHLRHQTAELIQNNSSPTFDILRFSLNYLSPYSVSNALLYCMHFLWLFIRSLLGLRAGLNLTIKSLERRTTSRTILLRILVHDNGFESAKVFLMITAEILTRSLANFHCQKADRHMNF